MIKDYLRTKLNEFSKSSTGLPIFTNRRYGNLVFNRKSIIHVLSNYNKFSDSQIATITGIDRSTVYTHRTNIAFEISKYKDRQESVDYWRKIIAGKVSPVRRRASAAIWSLVLIVL